MGRAGIVVNVMCVYGHGVTRCTGTGVCGVRVRGYVVRVRGYVVRGYVYGYGYGCVTYVGNVSLTRT